MAVTIRATSNNSASGTITITGNAPTGTTSGDTLWAFISIRGSYTIDTVPSGWTLRGSIDGGAGSDPYLLLYSHSYTTGSSWDWERSSTAGGHVIQLVATYGDDGTGIPTAFTTTDTGSTSTPTVPSATTADGEMAIGAVAWFVASGSESATWGTFTEEQDHQFPNSGGSAVRLGLTIGSEAQTGSSTGTESVTLSTSMSSVAAMLTIPAGDQDVDLNVLAEPETLNQLTIINSQPVDLNVLAEPETLNQLTVDQNQKVNLNVLAEPETLQQPSVTTGAVTVELNVLAQPETFFGYEVRDVQTIELNVLAAPETLHDPGVRSVLAGLHMGIELRVMDLAGTLEALINDGFEETSWEDPLNDVGAGSMTIAKSDPFLATTIGQELLGAEAKIISTMVNGVERGRWIVEEIQESITNDEIPVYIFTGRGIASELEWGTVLPTTYNPPSNVTADTVDFTTTAAMDAYKQLWDAANARGATGILSLSFSDTVDSDSVSWADSQDLEVPGGGNLLSKIRDMTTLASSDWHVDPDGTVDVRQTYGTDLSSSFRLAVGYTAAEMERRRTRRSIRNALYLEGKEGLISATTDATSITNYNRRETYIGAGEAMSSTTRDAYLAAALEIAKNEQTEWSVVLDDPTATGREPWVDFDLGDTLNVYSGEDNIDANVRVLSISISQGRNHDFATELTLESRLQTRNNQLARAMKTLTGLTDLVEPDIQYPAPVKLSEAVGEIDEDNIATGSVSETKLATGSVSETKIASNSVTTPKIATNAVTANEIAAGTITASQIATGTITATQLAANSVDTSELVAGSVTASIIAANTITASEIAASTITASEIAASTITTTQIAASTILAADIAAGTLTSASGVFGTISADDITTGTLTAVEIETSASGGRILISPSNDQIQVMNSGTVQGGLRFTTASMELWDGVGSSNPRITLVTSGGGDGQINIAATTFAITAGGSLNVNNSGGGAYGGSAGYFQMDDYGGSEGGQVRLQGAGSNPDLDLDAFVNSFRLLNGGTVEFEINTSTNVGYINGSTITTSTMKVKEGIDDFKPRKGPWGQGTETTATDVIDSIRLRQWFHRYGGGKGSNPNAPEDEGEIRFGAVAEEVAAIYPDAVHTKKGWDHWEFELNEDGSNVMIWVDNPTRGNFIRVRKYKRDENGNKIGISSTGVLPGEPEAIDYGVFVPLMMKSQQERIAWQRTVDDRLTALEGKSGR